MAKQKVPSRSSFASSQTSTASRRNGTPSAGSAAAERADYPPGPTDAGTSAVVDLGLLWSLRPGHFIEVRNVNHQHPFLAPSAISRSSSSSRTGSDGVLAVVTSEPEEVGASGLRKSDGQYLNYGSGRIEVSILQELPGECFSFEFNSPRQLISFDDILSPSVQLNFGELSVYALPQVILTLPNKVSTAAYGYPSPNKISKAPPTQLRQPQDLVLETAADFDGGPRDPVRAADNDDRDDDDDDDELMLRCIQSDVSDGEVDVESSESDWSEDNLAILARRRPPMKSHIKGMKSSTQKPILLAREPERERLELDKETAATAITAFVPAAKNKKQQHQKKKTTRPEVFAFTPRNYKPQSPRSMRLHLEESGMEDWTPGDDVRLHQAMMVVKERTSRFCWERVEDYMKITYDIHVPKEFLRERWLRTVNRMTAGSWSLEDDLMVIKMRELWIESGKCSMLWKTMHEEMLPGHSPTSSYYRWNRFLCLNDNDRHLVYIKGDRSLKRRASLGGTAAQTFGVSEDRVNQEEQESEEEEEETDKVMSDEYEQLEPEEEECVAKEEEEEEDPLGHSTRQKKKKAKENSSSTGIPPTATAAAGPSSSSSSNAAAAQAAAATHHAESKKDWGAASEEALCQFIGDLKDQGKNVVSWVEVKKYMKSQGFNVPMTAPQLRARYILLTHDNDIRMRVHWTDEESNKLWQCWKDWSDGKFGTAAWLEVAEKHFTNHPQPSVTRRLQRIAKDREESAESLQQLLSAISEAVSKVKVSVGGVNTPSTSDGKKKGKRSSSSSNTSTASLQDFQSEKTKTKKQKNNDHHAATATITSPTEAAREEEEEEAAREEEAREEKEAVTTIPRVKIQTLERIYVLESLAEIDPEIVPIMTAAIRGFGEQAVNWPTVVDVLRGEGVHFASAVNARDSWLSARTLLPPAKPGLKAWTVEEDVTLLRLLRDWDPRFGGKLEFNGHLEVLFPNRQPYACYRRWIRYLRVDDSEFPGK